MENPSFILSIIIPGDKPGIRNFFEPALLLARLLLGLRKRGLGHREDGTHGSLQTLKWGLRGRHGQHNTTFMLGGL